jgi:hypothetical protein
MRLVELQCIGYMSAERWMTKPWLNNFMVRRVVKSDYLKEAVIDIIIRGLDPRKVFSLRGIIGSFGSG